MTFWRDTKVPKHRHDWMGWSEPTKLETRDSFHSAAKMYQVRLCRICNEAQTKTIVEVRT